MTGRTARAHLSALAATHGIPGSRVQEVVDLTGLGAAADKRVGGYSLGMGQRLGIAAALLGDPHTVVLDEPVNGLVFEGVVWVRHLAKYLAAEGRTDAASTAATTSGRRTSASEMNWSSTGFGSTGGPPWG